MFELAPVNITVPLFASKVFPLFVKLPPIVKSPEVDLKLPPVRETFPPTIISPEPPSKIPSS